jgi:hypothetical protein
MALTQCTKCLEKVDSTSRACPNCGVYLGSKRPFKVVLYIIILLIAIPLITDLDKINTYFSSLDMEKSETVPDSQLAHHVVKQAINSIEIKPTWDKIEVREVKKTKYALTLWYNQVPKSIEVIEEDTKLIASAILKTLNDSDINPEVENVALVVNGQIRMKNKTGAELDYLFGYTYYNYRTDGLIFEIYKE